VGQGALAVRTVVVRGVAMSIEVSSVGRDWNGYWDDVEGGRWEPDAFDAIDRFLTPESCFVDVGAWVGPLSLYAAKKCRQVYAFEPDQVARAQLVTNVSLSEARNVEVDPRAVSNKSGRASFGNRHGYGDSESSLNWPQNPIEVFTARLEDLWADHQIQNCGLVKIDTEGGEGYILPDAAMFLKSLGVPIHLSLHGEWVRADQRAAVQWALSLWGKSWDGKFRGSMMLE